MTTLFVTDRDGTETALTGKTSYSVMEIIREAGIESMLALCGGTCSCATCHVYVDPNSVAALPPMGDDEDQLLGYSSFREPTSRLSCQIECTEAVSGLRVTIAPED